MPSEFCSKLAEVASEEFDNFHLNVETDDVLRDRIAQYYAFLGFPFPGVQQAWSGAFVSWCVKTAGATASEFVFSLRHSVYVHAAIQNALNSAGVFRAFPVGQLAPQIGDIVHSNRGDSNNSFDYEFARTHDSYDSHCAVVVDVGQDGSGRFAVTVGGNESDSIHRRVIPLDANGLIVQRHPAPYICVIQDLK